MTPYLVETLTEGLTIWGTWVPDDPVCGGWGGEDVCIEGDGISGTCQGREEKKCITATNSGHRVGTVFYCGESKLLIFVLDG